jgi:hypothetical protein
MNVCNGIKADGGRCKAQPMRNSEYCINHDPAMAEARKARSSKGGKRGGRGRPLTDVGDIRKRLSDLANDTLEGNVDTRVAAVVSQVLNVLLRAVTVELQVREQQELVERLEEIEQYLDSSRARRNALA